MAQALVRFPAAQHVERDGVERRFFEGALASSATGHEIAGGLGVKMADTSLEVHVMVGDGSYLIMAQESSRPYRRASS